MFSSNLSNYQMSTPHFSGVYGPFGTLESAKIASDCLMKDKMNVYNAGVVSSKEPEGTFAVITDEGDFYEPISGRTIASSRDFSDYERDKLYVSPHNTEKVRPVLQVIDWAYNKIKPISIW